MGIIAEASSPYHPQSNGLAESSIKNIKSLLYKCKYEHSNFDHAFAQWLQNPRQDGYSPSDLFFKRHLRGLLPSLPKTIDTRKAEIARDKTQEKYRQSMSKHNPLPPLKLNDKVVMQNIRTGLWDRKGKIHDIRNNGESYWIITDEGDKYLRGRSLIKGDIVPPINEQTHEQTHKQTNKQKMEQDMDRKTELEGHTDILPTRTSRQKDDDPQNKLTNSHSRPGDEKVSSNTRSKGVLRSVSFYPK